jgi:hypothetical protein
MPNDAMQELACEAVHNLDSDDINEDEGDENYEDVADEDVIWIMHVSGVFCSRVYYCNCSDALAHHIQLL